MTRSRKQKAAARTLSAAEGTSYVKSFYATKSPFTGFFASALELADRHTTTVFLEPESEWERTTNYCREDTLLCGCVEKAMPERHRFWESVFSFLPPHIVPELVGIEYVDLTYTKWLWLKGPSKPDTYTPTVYATFFYPEGMDYGDFVGMKEQITDALEGRHVAILPVGKIDGYEEMHGTIGADAFRIAITEAPMIDHFSTYEWHSDFASYALFDHDLWNIKHSVRYSSNSLTEKSSPRKINEVAFTAEVPLTSQEMKTVADLIRKKTGAAWASVMEGDQLEFDGLDVMESRGHYVAHYGDHPSTRFTDKEFLFGHLPTLTRKTLRYSTSGEKNSPEGEPSVFSGGDIVPVGFSDCTVQRDDDGIITSYKLKY